MSKKFLTIDELQVAGKRVLIRVDLNVPIQNGVVTSKERITRSVPTIKELSDKKAKVIILTHLGRPKGDGFEKEFSMEPVAKVLEEVLGKKVTLVSDCVGSVVKDAVSKMQDGDVLMLENVRFYKAETKNDLEFTKQLAENGDIYVSDAFSAAHRAHSSTEGLAHLLPSAAGRLMEDELSALEKALGNPQKPVVAIVGGAKVSTKLDVFHNLVKKVNYVVVGGGMANTFLHALGVEVGSSLCERGMSDECNKIINEAAQNNCQLILPTDFCSARELKANEATKIGENGSLEEGFKIMDAGPKSIVNFLGVLESAKTVIWNGPLGAFEIAPFNNATDKVAVKVGELTTKGQLVSIAGGGDTVSALQQAGVYDKFTYISTAGGAFLEWMEGKELPGVVCLLKK